MKKIRWKARTSFYPIIWIAILIASGFLLAKFIRLSVSDDLGQASDAKGSSSFISGLCIKAMEAGSSLLSFQKRGESTYPFLVGMIANEFALLEYSRDNITQTASVINTIPTIDSDIASEITGAVTGEVEKREAHFEDITKGYLAKEYVLTNGEFFASIDKDYINFLKDEHDKIIPEQLEIGYEEGNVKVLETEDKTISEDVKQAMETMTAYDGTRFSLDQLNNVSFLIRNFYIIDEDAAIEESLFDAKDLLAKDMTIKQGNDKPQILIYHTHSQEKYLDSRPGVEEDTVVGVGSLLAETLEDKYGYNVIHDKTVYDLVDGKEDRNYAYNLAKVGVEKILEKYPSIEVVIDLHRDDGDARLITIDGEDNARIMLFNGLSRDQYGPITRLDNPNLENNLAFSLQLQLKSLEMYPKIFYKNYLHCYRYNLHVRPKSLLLEWGTWKNTLQSAKNSVEPFAKLLDAVLQGE